MRAPIALVLVGLVYGACVAGLAVLMTGAGHGWSSGGISSTAVATVPMCALAWSLRDRSLGRVLGALLTACMLATDAGIVLASQREGTGYLLKVWNAAPGFAGRLVRAVARVAGVDAVGPRSPSRGGTHAGGRNGGLTEDRPPAPASRREAAASAGLAQDGSR
jgi:hypothetical protein